MKFKSIIPKRTTIIKSIIIILMFSLVSTYITSALSNQARITPNNPLHDKLKDPFSAVPLFGGNLDLVNAEEKSKDEERRDEELEEEKQEEQKEDKPKENKQEKQEEKKKQKNENKEVNQENKEKKKKNKQTDQDKSPNNNTGNVTNGGAPSTDANDDSPHIEIVDPDDEEVEDMEENNDFFTTTIKQGEVVSESTYAFQIKQLKHDYTLQYIDVSIETEHGKVDKVSDDYRQPVHAQLNLAKGENEIKVAATYKDESEAIFTVLRNYTVIYDEEQIVIETDLNDQKVTEENIKFTASAKQGNKQIALTVQLTKEKEQIELQEIKINEYEASLQEGKNEFTLSAVSDDNQVEKTITIHYEKPAPPKLKIVTNLTDYHDKKVKDEALDFTAEAFDGEKAVPLHVSHEGNTVESDNSSYQVTLIEGKNTFELMAEKDSYSESVNYTVYYEPAATGGEEENEPNEKEPDISISDITDGETIKNSIRTFHIKVKDFKGNSITKTGKVSVTNNGEQVPRDWTDSNQISFTLPISNGTNEVIVRAEDAEGNKASKTLTIHGEVNDDGAPIGTATVSIEATTVGLGYFIAPQEVEIYQGERASYVLDRLLKENGFDYMNTGSLDSSFYLSAVHKPGISSNINIPEDLQSTLEDNNVAIDITNIHPDVLGEFDLTGDSGWMYSVNGIYANVGFADYYLKAGDVMRIRFTLAEGNDIGLGLKNFHKEW